MLRNVSVHNSADLVAFNNAHPNLAKDEGTEMSKSKYIACSNIRRLSRSRMAEGGAELYIH